MTTFSFIAREWFWNPVMIHGTVALAVGVGWIKTGRSPFLWLASLFLHLEAARRQALASLRVAFLSFRDGYRAQHTTVRREQAGPGPHVVPMRSGRGGA